MLWWSLYALLYVLGMISTSYALGRYTSPDHMHWSSELRAAAPILIPFWPVLLLFVTAIPIIHLGNATHSVASLPFKVGNAHRIEYEQKTKLLAAHIDYDHIKRLEKELLGHEQ